MANGILDLSIIILIATALGITAKILKQPLILAYLITGVIIGYFGFFNLVDKETFKVFSDLGIMFLLFLVGLEIDYASLRLVGKSSLIIGGAQVLITFILGFLMATAFNFDYIQSAYLSFALTISSTVIVVKLLSDKKDLNSLYGKISIGLLLVEDFLTIILLFVLSGAASGEGLAFGNIILAILKGLALFALMIYLGKKIIPLIFDKVSYSHELLFLTSIAWVFVITAIINKIGFSIEIGGLLAGIALANSSEHFQIANTVKSLRDFFILIFFVILGSSIVFSNLNGLSLPIIVFSLFILIGNPLIIITVMGLMGYRKRTSFLTGLTTAQVSEFSFVLAALGLKVNHLNEDVVAIITAVGIITIVVSTYMIVYAEEIFRRISPLLSFFERRKTKEDGEIFTKEFHKPTILIGFHRTGQSIALNLPKEDILVIDFDPEIASQLKKQGYDYIFGDVVDQEIFEKANFKEAKLVISTNPNFEDSLNLLIQLAKLENRKQMKVVVRSKSEEETELLYANGADYVLLPHFTAGQYLGKTIAIDPTMEILEQLKIKDIALLKMTKMEG